MLHWYCSISTAIDLAFRGSGPEQSASNWNTLLFIGNAPYERFPISLLEGNVSVLGAGFAQGSVTADGESFVAREAEQSTFDLAKDLIVKDLVNQSAQGLCSVEDVHYVHTRLDHLFQQGCIRQLVLFSDDPFKIRIDPHAEEKLLLIYHFSHPQNPNMEVIRYVPPNIQALMRVLEGH